MNSHLPDPLVSVPWLRLVGVAKIEPRRRYAVRATIRSEGKLPSKVDLMLVRVAVG